MLRNRTFLSLFLLIVSSFACSCSHTAHNGNVKITKKYIAPSIGSGYSIVVPAGWHEVRNHEEVKKHLFWEFSTYDSTLAEKPFFRAWDAPAEDSTFMTLMEVARHSGLKIGVFYDDVIGNTQEIGWNIQETGMTKIDGELCKWWVQTYSKGTAKQQCFFFGHDDRVYILVFTTSNLNEDNKKLFDKIAHTITFDQETYEEGFFD